MKGKSLCIFRLKIIVRLIDSDSEEDDHHHDITPVGSDYSLDLYKSINSKPISLCMKHLMVPVQQRDVQTGFMSADTSMTCSDQYAISNYIY